MPPKPKNKLLTARVNEDLYKITTELADKAGEYLSGYIRKAVEMRNGNSRMVAVFPRDKEAAEALFNGEHPSKAEFEAKLTKPDTIIVGEQTAKTADKLTKPTIPEPKEKVKEMEKPDRQVQTFMKGGK